MTARNHHIGYGYCTVLIKHTHTHTHTHIHTYMMTTLVHVLMILTVILEMDIGNGYIDTFDTFDDLNNEEMVNVIEQPKTGNSSAEDMVINEFFIYGKYILFCNLHIIFNHIFNLGCFPENWTDGYIKRVI